MLYFVALFAPLLAQQVVAVGTAFGYATGASLIFTTLVRLAYLCGIGTTGGGSAAAATPTSNAQLVSWLGDSTARVIVLTTTFDFTGTTTSGLVWVRRCLFEC